MSVLRDKAQHIVDALRAKPRLYYAVVSLMTQQKLVLGPWERRDRTTGEHWIRFDGAGHEIALVRASRNGPNTWCWGVKDPGGNTQHPDTWTSSKEKAQEEADAWLKSVGITLLEDV